MVDVGAETRPTSPCGSEVRRSANGHSDGWPGRDAVSHLAHRSLPGALIWRNLASFGSINSFREFTGNTDHKQPYHSVITTRATMHNQRGELVLEGEHQYALKTSSKAG